MSDLPAKQSTLLKVRNKILDIGLGNKITRSIMVNTAPNLFGYYLTDYVLSNDDSELSKTMEVLSSMKKKAVKENISQIISVAKGKINTNSNNNALNKDKLANMILDSVTAEASEIAILEMLNQRYFMDYSISDETCKRISDLIDFSDKTTSEIDEIFTKIGLNFTSNLSYNLFENLTLKQKKEHFIQIIPLVSFTDYSEKNLFISIFSQFPEEDRLEQYKKILEVYKEQDNKRLNDIDSLSKCFTILQEAERLSVLEETFEQIRTKESEYERSKIENALIILESIPAKAQEVYFKEVLGYNMQYLYQINRYVSVLDKSLLSQIVFDVIDKARQTGQITENSPDYPDRYIYEIIDCFDSEIGDAFLTILNGDVDNPNAKFIIDLLNKKEMIETIEKKITKQQSIKHEQLIAFQQKGYDIDGLTILYVDLENKRILNDCVNNPDKNQYKHAIREISEMTKDIKNIKNNIIFKKKLDTYLQLFSIIKPEEREDIFLDFLSDIKNNINNYINVDNFEEKIGEIFCLLEKEAQVSQFPNYINLFVSSENFECIENLMVNIDPETMDLILSKYIEMFNKGGKENYLTARVVLISDKFSKKLVEKISKEDGTFLTEKELENILSGKYSFQKIPNEYYNLIKTYVAVNLEKIKNKYNNLDGKSQNIIDLNIEELTKLIGNVGKYGIVYESIIEDILNEMNKVFSSLDNEEKIKHFDTLFKAFDERIENENIRNTSFINLFKKLDNDTKIEIFKHCTSISSEKLKYSAEILSNFSIKELNVIFKDEITLDEETIIRLMEIKDDIAIKTLLFDKDIDREKLVDLSLNEQLQTDSIDINSIMQRLYLKSRGTDKDRLNQLLADTYNLFTYNNIPEFMKNFRMFQLGNYYEAKNSNLKSFQDKAYEERDKLIFGDLFEIALDSNSESLRDFLTIIIEGDKLVNLLQENPEENIKSFSIEELALLTQYRDTLVDFHNLTKEIKNTDKPSIEKTDDIIKDLRVLSSIYSDGQDNILCSNKVINELFKDFIRTDVTPEKMLEYMDNIKAKSDARHLEIEKRLREGTLHLQEDDFIKGIQNFDVYISSMLHDGIKGGEFNKEKSHSDATPLDADFGYISKGNLEKENATDYEIIETTYSYVYGSNYIVLKQYADRMKTKTDDGIFVSLPDYYKMYSGEDATKNTAYIRTGVPITDVDYIVSKSWNAKNGYEMAMAGIYIPVIDTKGEIVFSSEDYKRIREEMRGLSHYHADDIQVSQDAKNIEALYSIYRGVSDKDTEEIEREIETVRELVEGKPDSVTEEKKKAIIKFIKDFFNNQGIIVTDDLSQNLSSSSIELIDTGSTGRATNVPGDGDFDFMLRHNLSPELLSKFFEIVKQLDNSGFVEVADGFRAKEVVLPTGEIVDIDITTAKKSINLSYSSDMCVRDRLNNIMENDPESYNYVKANIIMAKKILKAKGIYKRIGSNGATEYGGFGGIGVENWILQNGGSFKKAIDTFLEAASQVGNYEEFKKKYPIFDFGFNHREGKASHACFSTFFNEEKGFEYVKSTLEEIQKALELEMEKQEMEIPLLESISSEGLIEASKKKSVLREKFSYSQVCSMIAKYISTKENPEVQHDETQNSLEED